MKKVYISGQISGLPWTEVEKKFTAAENAIIEFGCEPVSPLKDVIFVSILKKLWVRRTVLRSGLTVAHNV